MPLEHMEGVSPGWPIDYDTLAPYYDRAERCTRCTASEASIRPNRERGTFPHPPIAHAEGMAAIVGQLRAQGLHPSPLPLGIRDGCVLCNTCNSFACKVHAKSEAEVCCVRPAIGTAERRAVDERVRAAAGDQRRRATRWKRSKSSSTERPCASRRSLVIVSCGAVNSAALLLRSANDTHPNGLANSSGLVGRRYMAHLATMMQGFHPFRKNETVFQKTVAINDFYFRGPQRRIRSDRSSRRGGRTA